MDDQTQDMDGAVGTGAAGALHDEADAPGVALADSLHLHQLQRQIANLNSMSSGESGVVAKTKIARPATLQDIRELRLHDLQYHQQFRQKQQHQQYNGNSHGSGDPQSGSKAHIGSGSFSRQTSASHLSRTGTLQSRYTEYDCIAIT